MVWISDTAAGLQHHGLHGKCRNVRCHEAALRLSTQGGHRDTGGHYSWVWRIGHRRLWNFLCRPRMRFFQFQNEAAFAVNLYAPQQQGRASLVQRRDFHAHDVLIQRRRIIQFHPPFSPTDTGVSRIGFRKRLRDDLFSVGQIKLLERSHPGSPQIPTSPRRIMGGSSNLALLISAAVSVSKFCAGPDALVF